MRIIFRIAILATVALVVAASVQPASASCDSARLIGGCGGGGCKYIYVGSAGQNISSALGGSFWAWGSGNPVIIGPGGGIDNGSDTPLGAIDSWVHGQPAYLAGSWSNIGVDGCADASPANPKKTVVSLTDVAPSQRVGSSKLAGYFAILCAPADSGSNYDFSFTAGQHVLAAIPYPSVTNSGPGSVGLAAPSSAGLAAGTYALDASCTGLIRGYKVCSQLGTANPTDLSRATGGWVCGAEVPIGQPTTQAVPPCGSTQLLFLATSLVFESGFETPYVSENTKVSCGLTADRPSNFKLIKKPKTTTPQH